MANKTRYYNHNGWEIHGVGGFCTVRHFWAEKENISHWAFKLKECKDFCDKRDIGEELNPMYLKALF